jgi:5-methylcytosine-specific restriction endonuclease McrA
MNHPIDTRNKKFNLWRKLYSEDKFLCKSCGVKVIGMPLIKCTNDGSVYKPDGRIKHTFHLIGENESVMTIDHWIPKSFLRDRGLKWNIVDNLAIMCENCNKFKSDMLPDNWEQQYRRMNGSGPIEGKHRVEWERKQKIKKKKARKLASEEAHRQKLKARGV